MFRAVFAAAALAVLSTPAAPAIDIQTSDVPRFYAMYAATGGHPTQEQVQQQYLDRGSAGLHRLVAERRSVSAASIARNIAKRPEMYANARQCVEVLPSVAERLQAPLQRFHSLYAAAVFAPVSIVISAGKPAAIADADGVIVSAETICAVTWMNADMSDRLVHTIAHEYVHVQQARAEPKIYDDPQPTVLQASLIEGAAEFLSELATGVPGEVSSAQMLSATRGHEKSIESAFVQDEDARDLSKWIDNSTLTKQGDLGYWVGYRIVKSYYEHAANKADAVRDVIQMNDPKAFLARSAWQPGMTE